MTEGEPITIECNISGIPSPEVTWLRGKRDVTTSEKRYVIQTRDAVTTLSIEKAIPQDSAEFALQVKNQAGSDSFKVKVEVKGQ